MQTLRTQLISSLLLYSAPALLIGLLLGALSWCLSAALLLWIYQQTKQLERMAEWLKNGSENEPPEATGHWGELFDGLSRLQKRHKLKELRLTGYIERFQQSSAALTDGVVIIDKHNSLEWWNKTATSLLGFKEESDRGKPLMNLLRDPRFIQFYNAQNYEDSLQLPSPIDTEIVLEYQITLFGDNDRLLVARDVSHMVRLEKTRQLFVSNVSHELRTPLTSIRGFAETLTEFDLPPRVHSCLAHIEQESIRMGNLVEDLLLLSRLESVKAAAVHEPVYIVPLLEPIKEISLNLAKNKRQTIHFNIDSSVQILGRETELQSAFSNLIYNAIRYTPEEGTISVCWYIKQNIGYFEVTDNGIGIEASHIPRLTERFYRVDESRSKSSGGTGLGLAIVKHSLMRHHAKLIIRSKVGKGSSFICEFPAEMLVQIGLNDLPKVG